MDGIKPMKKIMIVLCIFGLAMGAVFPIYAGYFIEWIPGRKTPFIMGCYVAGAIVGMFGYYIVKKILMMIDDYYKKTLQDKLGIDSARKNREKKDLLLDMKEEFEELLNRFADMIKKENERLTALSITDSLTSLYNHRYFYEYFCKKISGGCEELTILFCDIDHFKSVNDIHGHMVGDLVLKDVANTIKKVIGDKGEVFRYGGEEFAILLENHDSQKARDVAEDVRLKVRASNVTEKSCNFIPVTISIGLASYPFDGKNVEDLIDKADRAMYYAKQRGRNQCAAYNCGLDKIVKEAGI